VRVLFINHHHLDSNSGIHIFCLANQLTQLGIECIVCVPNNKEMVTLVGKPLFEVFNIDDLFRGKNKLINIDLIHAWTPREIVRKTTQELVETYNCPYIVHLEDNEEFIIEAFAKPSDNFFLKHLPPILLDRLTHPSLSHPLLYKDFLKKASGITLIIDSLQKFCPENIPNQVIWAGYQNDLQWNTPTDLKLKEQLGIAAQEFIVVYTGNTHAANRQEVASLYEAIELLYCRGVRIKLVRTGTDSAQFGHVSRRALPSLLSIADVLVQPGRSDQFNDYRFPSKLPEYLASGKPVILPNTNIGRFLTDKVECLLLNNGDAPDIVQKLESLLSNAELRNIIGTGGRKFAEKHLQWRYSAVKLHSFYLSVLKYSSF
jgi:glycosyltransferase involved in cell wall biosynthesis